MYFAGPCYAEGNGGFVNVAFCRYWLTNIHPIPMTTVRTCGAWWA